MIIRAVDLTPEGREVDLPLALDSLTTDADEAIRAEGFRLRGRVAPARGGMSFRGRVTGWVEVPCARCLAAVRLDVDRSFDLHYAFGTPSGKDIQIPDDDLDEAFLAEGEGIEVEEVAAEQIYLALPMKPLCGEACRGLCPRCRMSRNGPPCGCPDGDGA